MLVNLVERLHSAFSCRKQKQEGSLPKTPVAEAEDQCSNLLGRAVPDVMTG